MFESNKKPSAYSQRVSVIGLNQELLSTTARENATPCGSTGATRTEAVCYVEFADHWFNNTSDARSMQSGSGQLSAKLLFVLSGGERGQAICYPDMTCRNAMSVIPASEPAPMSEEMEAILVPVASVARVESVFEVSLRFSKVRHRKIAATEISGDYLHGSLR